MIERWAAVCYLEAEKGWRKVQGYHDLWMLRQALGWPLNDERIDLQREAA